MTERKSLPDVLAALRNKQSARGLALADKLNQGLIEAGAADGALKVGERLPDFMLASAEGRFVRSEELLARGPMVLSFYRGKWCPYCSAELEALNSVAGEIAAGGATLVTVTPEAGGEALRAKFERNFRFEILCDLDNGLALECGLVFRLPDEVQKAYLDSGLDLPKLYGNDSWFLPIPATYVVDRNGVVADAYVNPDYRYRLDPETILASIARLKP